MGNQLTCYEALRAFVDKLDVIHADPRYAAVWTLSSIHGCPYDGPDYAAELAAARAALAAVPPTLTARDVWTGIRLRLHQCEEAVNLSPMAELHAEETFFALAGAAGVPANKLEPTFVWVSMKGEAVIEWASVRFRVALYADFDKTMLVVVQAADDGATEVSSDLHVREVAALLWPLSSPTASA